MVNEQGPPPASPQAEVTRVSSKAIGPFQFGMCGAEIG